MLSKIFGNKGGEVIGSWRKLYASPNIIRKVKSRRMRFKEYVAHMRKI
jgi:hypothetical protein